LADPFVKVPQQQGVAIGIKRRARRSKIAVVARYIRNSDLIDDPGVESVT
jgi:hypothetical protein